jgi:TolB-like protein/Flp pilus assembly protein TadD
MRTPRVRLFVRVFGNLVDPADDEFTKGLTLEITSRLARLDPDKLAVIAPTTAGKYSTSTTSELMRILKVDYVLEGSVRRAKDKDEVHIDGQLITAADETLKWSDGYNGSLVDILSVEDRLTAGIAGALNVKPTHAAKVPSKTPVDINGYDAYLAGRRAWALRDLPGAVTAFQKAAKLLPAYAPAHSGLAAAYAVMGQSPNDGMEPRESAPMAVKEAHTALQLDPRNAESHCVLGNLALSYDWDFPTAEREFREAMALEPGNATAHQWLGQYFMVMNSIPEAQGETGQALELDPASPIFITARAEAFYYARDFDSTISHAQIAVQQFPQFVLGEFWLGSAYREKKMYPESLAHFQRALTLAPRNAALLMAYGHALAVSGDHAGAKAKLAELQAMARDRYIPAIYFAGIYTGLGDTDNAFAWLQKAVQQRNDRLIYLREDPISDPLRPDARFAALMQQVHTAD